MAGLPVEKGHGFQLPGDRIRRGQLVLGTGAGYSSEEEEDEIGHLGEKLSKVPQRLTHVDPRSHY